MFLDDLVYSIASDRAEGAAHDCASVTTWRTSRSCPDATAFIARRNDGRALDTLVEQGKVRYLGFSDTPAWKVAQAQTMALIRGWSPLVALQIEYSLLQRTVEGELTPMAQELGLGVTPWVPGVREQAVTPLPAQSWPLLEIAREVQRARPRQGFAAREIVTLLIVTGVVGLSGGPVGTLAMSWTTSTGAHSPKIV